MKIMREGEDSVEATDSRTAPTVAPDLAAEPTFILNAIADLIDGRDVTDFELSFPLVRAVCDLKGCELAYRDEQEELKHAISVQNDLVAVLKRHGRHPASCDKGTGVGLYVPARGAKCSCGIDAAIARAEGR